MFLKRLTVFYVYTIITLIAMSCNQISDVENRSSTEQQECISSIVDFSYPLKPPGNFQRNEIEATGLKNWTYVSNIPPALQDAIEYTNIYFVREINQNSEIWLKRWARNLDNQPQFLIYHMKSTNWETVSNPFPTNINPDDVLSIIIDKNQTPWGVLWSEISIGFLKFDENKRVFIKTDETPDFEDIRLVSLQETPKVFFSNRTLWRIQNDTLYKYETESGLTKKYKLDIKNAIIDNNNGVVNYLVDFPHAQDNMLAFKSTDEVYLLTNDSPELLTYKLSANSLTRSVIPIINQEIGIESSNFFDYPARPGRINGNSLFTDNAGNLWVNDYGWMDTKGTWYQVLRSPVFIGKQPEIIEYTWYRPNIIMQSTDKTLWFKSPNGLVRLNDLDKEWCWITTYRTNIIEDSNNNLHLIADGKLYKYPLGETK